MPTYSDKWIRRFSKGFEVHFASPSTNVIERDYVESVVRSVATFLLPTTSHEEVKEIEHVEKPVKEIVIKQQQQTVETLREGVRIKALIEEIEK